MKSKVMKANYLSKGHQRGLRVFIFLAAVALGMVNVMAFAPFSWWFLAPITLAGLFLLWHFWPSYAFGSGWWFGIGLFGLGTFWIFHSLSTFGNMPWWMAGPMVLIFVVAGGFWVGFVGSIYKRFASWQGALWVIPPTWVFAEFLREWAFTGFPWMVQGYTQIGSFGQSIARVGGVYSVSIFVVLCALLLCTLVLRRTGIVMLSASLIAIFLFSGTMSPMTNPNGDPINVRIVQANVDPFAKWGDPLNTIELYNRLSGEIAPDQLVVWPETSIPYRLDYFDVDLLPKLPAGASLIAGIIDYDENGNSYNSVAGFGAASGLYYKQHLVPFGEYLPFRRWLQWVLEYLKLPFSDVSSGKAGQQLLGVGDYKVAVVICYEDTFSSLTRAQATGSDFIITSSEESWFGPTFAAHQRLQMAQMRAIENGREIIRSSNTGLSTVIDINGRTKNVLPMFERGAVDVELQPYSGETTFSRVGNLAVKIFALVWFLIVLAVFFTRNSRK